MHTITKVGVVGASGKMGKVVCNAIIDDDVLELVAAVARSGPGSPMTAVLGRGGVDLHLSDRLDTLTEAEADVAVDFTHPDAVMSNARWYAAHHLHAVIGTTGISAADLDEMRASQTNSGVNVIVCPDFSRTGAVMVHIAQIVARHMSEVELVEIFPPTKADAPSATLVHLAKALTRVKGAQATSASREFVTGVRGGEIEGIHAHALRLSGAPATEEVRFAQGSDTLTITMTSHQRDGYAAGALLAIKAVASRAGLTYGLAPLLGMDTEVAP